MYFNSVEGYGSKNGCQHKYRFSEKGCGLGQKRRAILLILMITLFEELGLWAFHGLWWASVSLPTVQGCFVGGSRKWHEKCSSGKVQRLATLTVLNLDFKYFPEDVGIS